MGLVLALMFVWLSGGGGRGWICCVKGVRRELGIYVHVAAVETMATMMVFCLLSKMVYGSGFGSC